MYILLLIFYGFVIVLLGYTFVFADVENKGLNGKISRFLFEYMPRLISEAIARLAGPTIYKQIVSYYNYAVNERNPIMQYLYLAVLNGSFITWLIFGAPKLPNSMIGYHHRYIAYAGLAACHYSFYIACLKSPGVIVKGNSHCFAHHKYDGVLYVDGHGCRTCGIKKVRYRIYILFVLDL